MKALVVGRLFDLQCKHKSAEAVAVTLHVVGLTNWCEFGFRNN